MNDDVDQISFKYIAFLEYWQKKNLRQIFYINTFCLVCHLDWYTLDCPSNQKKKTEQNQNQNVQGNQNLVVISNLINR